MSVMLSKRMPHFHFYAFILQDLVDRGYGYDVSDSFVDDSEFVSCRLQQYPRSEYEAPYSFSPWPYTSMKTMFPPLSTHNLEGSTSTLEVWSSSR